jgi:hypothetical protein
LRFAPFVFGKSIDASAKQICCAFLRQPQMLTPLAHPSSLPLNNFLLLVLRLGKKTLCRRLAGKLNFPAGWAVPATAAIKRVKVLSRHQQFMEARSRLFLYFDSIKQFGGIQIILATVVDHPDHAVTVGGCQQFVKATERKVIGGKIATVFPRNADNKFHSHSFTLSGAMLALAQSFGQQHCHQRI